MLAAGTDSFCFDTQRQTPTAITAAITENDDGYLLGELRRAAKNILYNDANSNIMNGLNNNSVIVSITPWWQPALHWTIAGFAALTALCLIMLTIAKVRYNKEKGAVQG